LTQDATGTLAYLQFEAMKVPKVKTELSISYVDHNTLQEGFENFDDHLFLQSFAAKYGIYFSKPGNGICHQLHTERFSAPGKTLLGSDSHTPTSGGAGMLSIGAGGLDVALAMAGEPFNLSMPKVVKVELRGRLKDWVSAKDIILEVLRRLTVKGGVGKVFEYSGEGVLSLEVPDRATICNMGAELGATSSIFPSDEITRAFLKLEKREKDWIELQADKGADYDEEVIIELGKLLPLAAQPHSPDNIEAVSKIKGKKVDQVIVGSCTNSSYRDLMAVRHILKGKKISDDVSFAVAPGSRQVLELLARNGALADIIKSGARILESACGPCIGMGQAPCTAGVTLRTFNRNFKGRSGTADASIYLVSPEVAAYSALKGVISDPTELGKMPEIKLPDSIDIDDSLIIAPSKEPGKVEVLRGPNIKPLPEFKEPAENVSGKVLIKLKDNITTDDIMPAGAKILPLRSNIPAISEYVFSKVDKDFPERAKEAGGGFIVGGANYGQGSSREHAAIAPKYLGVKAVLAKSFARIHMANLINFGILPLTFAVEADYDNIFEGDLLEINGFKSGIGGEEIIIKNLTKKTSFKAKVSLNSRQKEIILAGSLLNAAGKKNT
ncbi:MAG: aconitate hydratase, partial [Candidatus Firestonebacteria bacterium]